MMKATTETTKLNFITDHGSTRERVSCAWRFDERRTLLGRLRLPPVFRPVLRPWKADATEPARPAAAPVTADAAPVAVKPGPPGEVAPGAVGRAPGADGYAPGAAVPVLAAPGVGPEEGGRASRHNGCPAAGLADPDERAASRPGAAEDAGAEDGAMVPGTGDDAGEDGGVDDAVKEGRRSPGEKAEVPEVPGFAGGAMIEPGAAGGEGLEEAGPGPACALSSAAASLFDGLNQPLVAAIAFLTAWRPLSSTALGPVAGPVEWPSPLTGSVADGLAAAESWAEPFFLPMSSAGNGTLVTRCSTSDAPLRREADPPPLAVTESSRLAGASASSFAAFWLAGFDDPDPVRDADMSSFSTTASEAVTSGSMSRPGGATITGGSVARPASSTRSSSVTLLTVCTLSRDYPTTNNLPFLSRPLSKILRNLCGYDLSVYPQTPSSP